MKKILKITALSAILLSLAGVITTCDKEKTGNVPFKLCPCEKEMSLWELQHFPRGEAYLFKDSIPEQVMNQISDVIYSAPFPKICWIIYYSETDVASIYISNIFHPKDGNIMSIGLICNFPDFAKEWTIPENGIKVMIEGLMYNDCRNHYAYYVPFDYVLTNLKRK